MSLPLHYELPADSCYDPLVRMLLDEEAEDEAESLESQHLGLMNSALCINALETANDDGALVTRKTNTAPGPCIIHHFK